MAKIHYDELTVGVPSKASSVNYENADGTKESVQSKIEHMETVELTKEEYDSLSYAEKHNGKDYLVKGMSPMTAYNMPYKDSTVGDGLDDVKQDVADLNEHKLKEESFRLTTDATTGFATITLPTSKKIVGIDVEQAGYFAMFWKSASGVYGITAIRNDWTLGKNVTLSGTIYYFD